MKKTLALIVVGLALAACGSGGTPKASGSSPDNMHTGATCSPAGTSLHITAKNIAFDTSCLAAPAGQAFTIDFANNDSGTTHNLAIFSADPATNPGAKVLFRGTEFAGVKSMTYNVSALAAGTYHFHCDIHPMQMFGTFIVG